MCPKHSLVIGRPKRSANAFQVGLRDADVVQTSSYDAAGVRVVKREGASTTLYLAPDFEVRDGLATTYVKAGHTSIVRVEEPAFATTFFPDVAPLAAGNAAESAPDGVITAADAWVVHAAKSGLVDLPPPAAAKAKTADVDKMLASAARRMLGADATQTTYVAHDHLGSPSLETNERGDVVARRWHGPYGEVRGATAAWAETRGFTGKERDETTGLADHGARYLDTRLGRWIAPDPLAVRELGGAELDVYGYVEGRVTSTTDPSGLTALGDRGAQEDYKEVARAAATPTVASTSPTPTVIMMPEIIISGDQRRPASGVNQYRLSENGFSMLKSKEGRHIEGNLHTLYNDQSGNATIGYGYMVHEGKIGKDAAKEEPYKNGLDESAAIQLLRTKVLEFEDAVNKTVTTSLTQAQFDALVLLAYNIGAGGFGTSTVAKRLNSGDTTGAAEAFMMWNKIKVGGQLVESKGLTNRRSEERQLFEKGSYSE